jgi:hypothetical protein
MEENKNTDGTVMSKLKPIVTMLTEALIKDFAPAYRKAEEAELWIRTAEDNTEAVVTAEQLQKDVETWLLGLEAEMENDSDRQYAKMVTNMIRKNPGWVKLLTNRVKRRIS